MHPGIITRRAVLPILAAPAATVAASVGAAALATAVRGPSPCDNAELEALFERWQRMRAELDAIEAMSLDEYVAYMSDDEFAALCADEFETARKVYACPATGVEALKIKAQVARQHLGDDPDLIENVAFRAVFDGITALAGGRL